MRRQASAYSGSSGLRAVHAFRPQLPSLGRIADDPAAPAGEPTFREVQRGVVQSPFMRALCWGLFAVMVVVLIADYCLAPEPNAGKAGLNLRALLFLAATILGVTVTLVIVLSIRMVTEVREDGLYVRVIPLHFSFRRIAFSDIVTSEARKYRPIMEYGGWGIRRGWKGNAYSMHGNHGVQLTFRSGRRPLLIGSQRAQELQSAIAAGLRS